jgi:hypothetical protein
MRNGQLGAWCERIRQWVDPVCIIAALTVFDVRWALRGETEAAYDDYDIRILT